MSLQADEIPVLRHEAARMVQQAAATLRAVEEAAAAFHRVSERKRLLVAETMATLGDLDPELAGVTRTQELVNEALAHLTGVDLTLDLFADIAQLVGLDNGTRPRLVAGPVLAELDRWLGFDAEAPAVPT